MIKMIYIIILCAGIFLPAHGYTGNVKIEVRTEAISEQFKPILLLNDSTYLFSADSHRVWVLNINHLERGKYGKLKIGKNFTSLYIEPGKSFKLNLNKEGAISEITGEGARKNSYLQRTIYRGKPDFKQDEHTFISYLEQLEKQLYAELDSLCFDRKFAEMEKQRLHYTIFSVLRVYPVYHAMVLQTSKHEPSPFYYEYIKKFIIEDESLLCVDECKIALAEFISAYSMKDLKNSNALDDVKAYLNYVDKNIKSAALVEHLTHIYVYSYINKMGSVNLVELMPFYDAKVSSPELRSKLTKICALKGAFTK